MIRATLALVFALVAVPAFAQSQRTTIDLSAFGWGTVEAFPVDTDGVPFTEEWAIRSFDTNQWRVVAVRPEGLCVGAWFAVSDGSNPFIGTQLVRVGATDKLKVSTGVYSQVFTLVSLDTPPCEP